MKDERRINSRLRPILRAERSKRIILTLIISFQLAICVIPSALAQRNAPSQSVAKLGSAIKELVEVGNALQATIILVTNTNDSGAGSLRGALSIANDGDTIDATGVSGTILLTSGELQINHNVTINGPGAENLAVDGNAAFRVFENFASDVIISGFTITNGLPPAGDSNGGGGILNHGGLTVNNSSIVSNHAGASPSVGGGIRSDSGGTLTVVYSTISDNVASFRFGGEGGGIVADGATVISASTINDNTAVCEGGGIISAGGALTVMNSTISGNSAQGVGGGVCEMGEGGGIFLGGGVTLTITNSTISDNVAQRGGGISNEGATQIEDTILNAGAGGSGTIVNDGGTVTSLGYNLASDAGGGVLTGPGDQINTDPMLGPLQDNGGPDLHARIIAW